jgi:Abnormal spindle-like microcephaly-assoc'd, ASPM-SPD-2-Hydin
MVAILTVIDVAGRDRVTRNRRQALKHVRVMLGCAVFALIGGGLVGATKASAVVPTTPAAEGAAYLVGEAGAYVVGNQRLDFPAIPLSRTYGPETLHFMLQSPGHDLSLMLAHAPGESWHLGAFDGAVSVTSRNAGQPGISIFGDGRGCNTATGGFVVNDVQFDAAGLLLKFSARFEFHCEGLAPAVVGAISYVPPKPTHPLAAPVPAGTASFAGDRGEYVSQGQALTFSVAPPTWLYPDTDSKILRFMLTSPGHNFELWLAPPAGQPWATGSYEWAERAPFQSAGHAGLSLAGDSRGCNTVYGRFVVDKLELDPSGLPVVFSAQFEQHCEGGIPAIVGAVSTAVVRSYSLSTSALKFSPIPKRSTSEQLITVSNTGNLAIALNPASITGKDAAEFSASTTCGAYVSGGASCTVTVRFTPRNNASKHDAVLTLIDDLGKTRLIALSSTTR